ncbi:hypothetical protein DL768_002185 [Monosporascus sp. mg162]|nr:hypothetical protein DL768_002185 [Monosporascus sp. mg162]
MVFEENESLLLARGEEAEPAKCDSNTTAAATPSTIITLLTNNNNHGGYNSYNHNNTYNDNTARRDSRHRNVGPTTAIIGSSSTATPTIIGPSATITIDYPVDGTLDPDLRAHIDHCRADNHDWKQ